LSLPLSVRTINVKIEDAVHAKLKKLADDGQVTFAKTIELALLSLEREIVYDQHNVPVFSTQTPSGPLRDDAVTPVGPAALPAGSEGAPRGNDGAGQACPELPPSEPVDPNGEVDPDDDLTAFAGSLIAQFGGDL
jgi:hypothetical protein